MNRAEFLALGGLLLVGSPGRALAALDGVTLAPAARQTIRGNWEGGWYVDDFGATRHLYSLRAYRGADPHIANVRWEGVVDEWPPSGELERLLIAEEERFLSVGDAIEAAYVEEEVV